MTIELASMHIAWRHKMPQSPGHLDPIARWNREDSREGNGFVTSLLPFGKRQTPEARRDDVQEIRQTAWSLPWAWVLG